MLTSEKESCLCAGVIMQVCNMIIESISAMDLKNHSPVQSCTCTLLMLLQVYAAEVHIVFKVIDDYFNSISLLLDTK